MTSGGQQPQLRVVLVNPKSSRNVGAVCRAMKTMGLEDLAIVGGIRLDYDEARRLAIHASDVLANIFFSNSLEDAVSNVSLVAGITRRRGKRRKYFIFRITTSLPSTRYRPVTRERLDRLVSCIIGSLQNLGFFKQVDPDEMGVFFRDILARAGLSAGEAGRLEGVFRKIGGLGTGKGLP